MIVRLTELVIDQTKINFTPFVMEIPDREIGWDGGYDHMEERLWDESFPEEVIQQLPENYNEFEFDYDFEYAITTN